jgi:DNA-damage-inducible protein J
LKINIFRFINPKSPVTSVAKSLADYIIRSGLSPGVDSGSSGIQSVDMSLVDTFFDREGNDWADVIWHEYFLAWFYDTVIKYMYVVCHTRNQENEMSKTTMITARIDPKLKSKTEKVLKDLGLTTTQAITLFFNQVSLRKALPFAVAIPNTATAKAIEDALAGIDLYEAENVDALFSELEA